ncbi:DUF4397 domain-containing protein [Pleionea litopenaei]|uniref:DUF4397 domain-containing protein n=1 Tax=Pleionea litopenaei TaxID=3070815 RepID=A0AA51X8M0_9GAMM|nr:DUF4397 domain-containing protein [Pleionea sp. HL-JVS1]WMS88225.1 DUF4397 domain-containing protein [Pleionea sp. HL-JVS1]
MNKPIKNLSRFLLMASSLFMLQACDIFDDDNDNATETPTPMAKVQVLHTSPDAPMVDVYAGGSLLLEDFDYATASERLDVPAGTLNVDVQGILPDGTTPSVIGPVDLTLSEDLLYSVLAIDSVSDIDALVVTRSTTAVSSGNFRAQVVHAAPDAPMVDVYVTAPGADLATEAALGTFEFQGSLGPVEAPAGDYQVRVTLAGDPATVVFDSGTIALTDGMDLTIAAIENTLTGDAPINLLVATASGSLVIQDSAAPADLRVVHASPNAPAVDVIVNDGQTPLVSNLAYPDATGFVSVDPATYNVKVAATGTTTPVINADLTLEQGATYSVLAVNDLDSIEALVLNSDRRRVATETKIQVIHGAPSAGTVDIYVTAQGADITNLDPAISGFEFKATTDGFLSLPAGDYDITVTATGTKTTAIGPLSVTLSASGLYTVIARDAARPNEGDAATPFGVILLDDFGV